MKKKTKRQPDKYHKLRKEAEKGTKRKFLCKEPGGANLPDEEFTVEAENIEEAREMASTWNAVVIKELHR